MLGHELKTALRRLLFPVRLAYSGPLHHPWVGNYLFRHKPLRLARSHAGPIDVMVLVVDHFEPAQRFGPQAAAASVTDWCESYSRIASRYHDADGRPPQHTWFYRAEYPEHECIRVLGDYCYRGLGEVEFHLHHGYDSHASFADKLAAGLHFFTHAGAMLSAEPEPRTRFGYIAGNWALDNGAGNDAQSGCNTEILALRDAGCYADFTFPAFASKAQPKKINAIYYATDTPLPKSYDRGPDVTVGVAPVGDLMLIQGPLVLDWSLGRIEDGAVESFCPPTPERLPAWLKANVHVRGRPEWIFVKLHCHGMQSKDVWRSQELDDTLAEICHVWNRDPFRLHFVTAREAYNIIKAAEAGESGDPGDFRNFLLPPPANSCIQCNVPWLLKKYSRDCVSVTFAGEETVAVAFRDLPVQSVTGKIRQMEMKFQGNRLATFHAIGIGDVHVYQAGQRHTFAADPIDASPRNASKILERS